jgi:hypothetical protein
VSKLNEDAWMSIEEGEGWGAGTSEAALRECLDTFPHIRVDHARAEAGKLMIGAASEFQLEWA